MISLSNSNAHRVAAAWAVLAPLAVAAAPVAWLDQPALMPVPDAVAAAPGAPCAQSDLVLTLGGQGAWHGQATQELLLRNRSAARCQLSALPVIELQSASGWQAARVRPMAETADAVELAPNEALAVLLGTPGACEATLRPERTVVRHLRVLPPGGGVLDAAGAHVDTTCGPAMIVRADRHGTRAARPMPGSTESLTVQVTTPATVVAGASFNYLVTLKNPGDQAVALSPCPSYEQVLNTHTGTTAAALRLNCSGAGDSVPAHGEVQFEMRASVPEASAHDAGVKLSWRLAGGPAAGTVIPLH
ncbi:MAG TPA: DUF4232 domain-containing protein [Ideonella sp.]|uniref:DUF4232 domain-containing protein n=1 Tax=Ideonella sp. TaxID=1929293 RepID=UPI002E36541A|nr:DUF4232 domain-containing protein [Ideonella sp.]HEX5684140.1 DUF4232 domain-containing protein [Ideonella sp.]